jgi:hypothetical protein
MPLQEVWAHHPLLAWVAHPMSFAPLKVAP